MNFNMQIFSFIKWHIRKITLDLILWGVFCFAVTAYVNTQNQTYLYMVQALFMYGFCKFTWYMTKESYEKFQKEQQDLFETIKNSDKK
jgi:hypothetical protein